jgi:hypothetical protein
VISLGCGGEKALWCGAAAGQQRRFVWPGCSAASARSCALSTEPVVASGELTSPADQAHPGELCRDGRGYNTSPGPATRRDVQRLNPEHVAGMRGGSNPAREPALDILFAGYETGCRHADSGDRIELLADQVPYPSWREWPLSGK